MNTRLHVPAHLRQWIQVNTGLAVTDANQAPVELAWRLVADRHSLTPSEFLNRLLRGAINPQAFIDEVTTHESYFFRAHGQMKLVAERIIPELLRKRPSQTIRILSLPCARGEEPYSIGIMLNELGVAAHHVRITAGDIAANCLADAKRGLYRRLALRRVNSFIEQRYFSPVGVDMVRLDTTGLARVDFHRFNMLTESMRVLQPGFDIVFCQNVLIYFDHNDVDKALKIIGDLMADDAWLFVDHAEWNLPRRRFQLQAVDGVYGYRPKQAESLVPESTAAPRQSAAKRPVVAPRVPNLHQTQLQTPPHRPSTPDSIPPVERRDPAPREKPQLQQAHELYEKKKFVEAIRVFDELISTDPNGLPRALLGKAQVLADCGQELEALDYAENALHARASREEAALSREDRLAALVLIGTVMQAKGLGDVAAGYFDQIKALDPDHPVLRLAGGGQGHA